MIITEDPERARRFMDVIDAAGVYWNASTRFADGFRYGFGAEIGVWLLELLVLGGNERSSMDSTG